LNLSLVKKSVHVDYWTATTVVVVVVVEIITNCALTKVVSMLKNKKALPI